MPPRREVPWDATVAEHLGVAETHAPGKGGLGSLGGAFIASLLIGCIQTFSVAL